MWPARSAFILFKYGTQNVIIYLEKMPLIAVAVYKIKYERNKNFSSLLGVQSTDCVHRVVTGLSFDFMGFPRKVASQYE